MATPAAAIAGIALGMSMHILATGEPEVRYVENTDTVCIECPVRDTIYVTQVLEKVKVVARLADAAPQATARNKRASEEDTTACTSVQCDGINYAVLALN